MTLPFHRAPNLTGLPGIAHGFFGREGGVSDGIYASLNCGPGSRDDPALVAENRARVVAALASGASWLPWPRSIVPLFMSWAPDWDTAGHPEGDGMVTTVPGLILGIQTAGLRPGAAGR